MLREAVGLEQALRLQEAEAAYKRLLAHFPDRPDSWYNLARLQRRLRHYDAALASYQQALERGVTRPEEVHLNRGVIYADCLRQDAAAERELVAALTLNPRYVPALFNLANLRSDFGRRDEALALYEQILAIDPHSYAALARYADLRPIRDAGDPLIGKLEDALADPAATPADKAELGFALGKALDRARAYDRAFAAYAAANRSSRDSAGPGVVLYDRGRQERFVDALIETFTRARSPIDAQAPQCRPIFICGMFRSGSTLTEQVLAAHPRVIAGGEIDLIPALVRQLVPFPARVAQLSARELDELAASYLASLAKLFPGADRVTDKRPDNFLYIGLIKSLFPTARIINTTRDPLDNCLSVYFLHLDHSMGYALDLMDIGHYYRQYRRLMKHWHTVYGADILDFNYDDFVREPRPALARLLAFCGLDYHEDCLTFHRVDNAVKTASVWQVREPLYQHASGRSRHYVRHLRALQAYLADLHDEPQSMRAP